MPARTTVNTDFVPQLWGEQNTGFPLLQLALTLHPFAMEHGNQTFRDQPLRGFAELLGEAPSTAPSGYRLRGASRGPHLAVAGEPEAVEAVLERLMSAPALPRMRGIISLRRMSTDSEETVELFRAVYDDVIMIRNCDASSPLSAEVACWKILQRCTEIGMISSLGVPSGDFRKAA